MKKPKIIIFQNFFNQSISTILLKCLFSFTGVLFIGFAIAFNSQAGFGNDPISVFFDGIRVACGLPIEKLGIASNFVCYTLLALVLIFGRKHINIGTFIYTFTLGIFIDLGIGFYQVLNFPFTIPLRILTCICGCLMLFLGIAIFIATNFGVDQFTALIMIIQEKLNLSFSIVKVASDILFLSVGFLLGGQVGIVTLVAAISGGPIINFFAKRLEKFFNKILSKV